MKKPSLLKLKSWVLAHKKVSIVLLVVFVGITYGVVKAFSNSGGETRYVIARVLRGNIISSINGTGQVSSSNQVDVTSKSSGDIIYLNAKSGQQVKAGALIAQIDAGDALYELETAKISYEELITVDDDELRDAEDARDVAEVNLKDAYVDGRGTLASAATDMADIMAGLDDLFSGYLSDSRLALSKKEKEYIDRAELAWHDADDSLDDFSKMYRTVSNKTSDEDIESLISDANKIANSVAETTKYSKDAVIYIRDLEDNESTIADEAYTTVSELVTTINATVSETLSARNTLTDAKKTLDNTQDDLQELKDGPDTLDVRAEELSLKQKQNAYADYFVRAPFDGIITSLDGKKGQNVNNGTTIATLITKQKIAQISLNEVDVAKVKVGQKATLTFDALSDLTITGEVIEVDLVGTVSQGVVNYIVKIGFDVDDGEVRPGMTVSADIIILIKQDVLMVQNSVIKNQGDIIYVETFSKEFSLLQNNLENNQGVPSSVPPKQLQVETGLSNDTHTEIVSGLNEGDIVVTRMITGGSTPTTTAAPSLFGGGARGATGGVRIPR